MLIANAFDFEDKNCLASNVYVIIQSLTGTTTTGIKNGRK